MALPLGPSLSFKEPVKVAFFLLSSIVFIDDEFLDHLKESGLGAYVGTCCIGSPMYADDLT